MGEIPSDVSIETVWIIEATYAPDAAETRPGFRPEHLGRIAELKRAGTVIEAGGYLDLSTALVIEAAALEIARTDVYTRNGVWVELRAKPFGRVRLEDAG
jgi:uncharacterized protein YciI